MRDDTKNGCVADFDVDNDVCDASFVHYEALFRVGWGKGYVCPWSEFQIGSFHGFRRRPRRCCYAMIFNLSLCCLLPFHLFFCHSFKAIFTLTGPRYYIII